MEALVYRSKDGTEAGKVKIPERLFGVRWNANLVHQVAESMRANKRVTIASVKDRGDVRGGGKKPWRQKGTGKARHGSIRSPLWVGGGVTHGPTPERDYKKKINRKMKTRALFTVLSQKFRDGEIILVDELSLSAPKTREARTVLERLAGTLGAERMKYTRGKRVLIVVPARDTVIERSFRNIASTKVEEARNVSPLDLLTYQYVVVVRPSESFEVINGRA